MAETIGTIAGPTNDFKPINEIFIVDDNDEYRALLAAILSLEGFQVTGFPDGASFLKAASSRVPLCVFLDIVMPGPSGLDILKKLNAAGYASPIFLISARRDCPAVVEAMKNGAHDFIEKPFDPYTAVLRVREAVEHWGRRAANAMTVDLPLLQCDNGAQLSRMERDVLAQIVAGASNAEIARALGTSRHGVANHRWRITRKLGAKNSADLVRLLLLKTQPRSQLRR